MSKSIKSIVASAVILFGCLSVSAHAQNLKPIKGCGYEIFSAVESSTGYKAQLCLHSSGGSNKVSLLNNKKVLGTFDVSDIQYLHTEMRAMDRVAINIPIPDSRDTLVFGTLKSGKISAVDLTVWKGRNPSTVIKMNPKTLKLNLKPGNSYGLEDYGIERRGPDARPIPSTILKAPSM